MSKELSPLGLEALETLAQIIGDHYTGSQISELFRRGGAPDMSHDGGTKWRFVVAAFERLQTRSGNKPNAVLQILKTAAKPEGWISRREQYEAFLNDINSVLEFYSLRITDEGKLLRIGEKATTVRKTRSQDEIEFDGRAFHPQIIKHGRSHFCRGAYFHAVFECCKAFDTIVRNNTGIQEAGQPLMSKAFSPTGPVKFNSQQTQSEKDE